MSFSRMSREKLPTRIPNSPGTGADVFDVHAHGYLRINRRCRQRDLQVAVLELGIGQPVPEGEERLDILGIEITISHEDPFRVANHSVTAG